MPRYHFHVRDDIHTEDAQGAELPDLEAAREVAMEAARELVCADVKHGWLNLDHYIEVADDKGAILLTLTFREAFEVKGTY